MAIRSVIQSVRVTLAGEARALLASDAIVQSNRPWTDHVRDRLDMEQRRRAYQRAFRGGRVADDCEACGSGAKHQPDGRAAGRAGGVSVLRQLTLEGRPYAYALLRGRGVLVRPELLAQLGLSVGDRLQIGTQDVRDSRRHRVRAGTPAGGVLASARASSSTMRTWSPPACWRSAAAPTTRLLLQVPGPALEPLVTDLRSAFANEFVGVRHYRRSEDQIGRSLTRAENYLSLVGLVVLILGGIGVSSVTRRVRSAEGAEHRHPEVCWTAPRRRCWPCT